LRLQTRGYGGRRYSRMVQITTNDPVNTVIGIQVTGDIKKFVTMTTSAVFLIGKQGEPISTTVKIVPETEPPFKLLHVNAMNGKDIRHSITEKEHDGRIFYELLIENAAEAPGRYYDRISIITDRSDQAPLTVNVRGAIQPADASASEGQAADAVSQPLPPAAPSAEQ
jgi:hypothetical protein